MSSPHQNGNGVENGSGGGGGGRGALLVFEGCDRCGKTTQTELLVKWLQETKNIKAQLMKFPDRSSETGKLIDGYLRNRVELSDQEIHLLFSANRWGAVSDMKRLLNSGVTLIVDRYAFSGVAFTAAKGLNLDWCKGPDVGLPRPDAVFFLNLSAAEARERGGYGEERYEREAFQEKVKRQYQILRKNDHTWIDIDASKPVEGVFG